MSRILRNLLTVAMVAAVVLFVASPLLADGGRTRGVKVSTTPTTPTAASFATNELEHYLSDDGIAYIRPGVKIKIIAITNVAAGKKPVVEFTLTDNFDQPLDRLGKVTPGPIAPGFILARWDADRRYYFALTTRTRNGVTNPSADQGGTYTDLELGHYKYNFGTAMPSDLDGTKTLTLGAYGRRTLSDIIGKDYYADNVFLDFRPDGGTATATWGAMSDVSVTCNKCHDPLALHGGTRRQPKNCMLCHSDQISKDATSGETFNGKVFFHKLHNAANLPSGKPYIAGGDWSGMTYPQDIRNCTTCHDAAAKENDIWYTRPNRDACGSCHDDINWVTGENHAGGKALDDKECASCHQPSSEFEFDASIKGAHTIPEKSKQLKGLTATIVSVSNMTPGKAPTVVYSLKNGDGTAVDGTKLATFSPILAGPATSYSKYYRESGASKAVFDATKGTTTYTFTAVVPADATGTWTLSGDFYRNATLKRGDGGADIAVRECAVNPIKYMAVTGTTATPRRTAVTMAQCNQCHDRLALHGGQRLVIDECVICHNPTEGDQSVRPASAGAKESISFQRMIHRIHTGEELTQDYTIYGHGGSLNNYNEVLFPGDRRNCAKCHTSGSYLPPLATSIDSVTTLRDYFTPQGPTTASCLGCHDNRDAAAHAYLNTTTFGGTTPAEACGACHSAGKDYGTDKVHAR